MVSLSADTGLKASVGVFLLSCTFLTTTYNTTFVFDRPINSIVFVCILSGISLVILGRFFHRLPAPKSLSHKNRYSVIPLIPLAEPGGSPLGERPSSPASSNNELPIPKSRKFGNWIRIAVVSGICCVRVGIYRQITLHAECAPAGCAYAIPFLISLYDYWRSQRSRSIDQWSSDDDSDEPASGRLRRIAGLFKRIYLSFGRTRIRYVIPAALLMLGGFITSSFHDGRESTYICPIVSRLGPHMRAVRVFSAILDSVILIAAAEMFREGIRTPEGKKKQSPISWGYCLLGVALIWSLTGIGLSRRNHVPILDPDSRYFRSVFGQAALVVFLLVSASQLLVYYGMEGMGTVLAH